MIFGFIGSGNMGGAIIGGIINSDIASSENVIVSDKNEQALKKINEKYGVKVTSDNKETAEHFRSRSSEVPLWHRQNISVEEASGYTGLGRDTIYSLTQEDDCDFVLKVGHRTMIKRKKFENYLENLSSI